jgi:hypothetical protein
MAVYTLVTFGIVTFASRAFEIRDTQRLARC